MSEDDTVINFLEVAERVGTARKPIPALEEQTRKAAKATAKRLDDADRVANAMRKKLPVEDRRILVSNLGAIVVSLFGGEIAAKRNMVDVFKAAFGGNWESQYKKRGRFFRFPSEGDPGDGPGATYAQGWAYLDLARALSRLDPRTDPADDRAENRMILRMIEGTTFDGTGFARSRHTGKLEAAFADRLRTLVRSLDPKLGRMLGAGLETGRTVDDFSTDLEGMSAHQFLDRKMPSVEIGSITQKLPVVLAIPLGITVEELARRFADRSSDAEARRAFLRKNEVSAHCLDEAQGDEFQESLALAVFGSSDFTLEIAAEALGIAKPADADPGDLRWLLDAVGQARLKTLFELSNARFYIDREFPTWAALSGVEVLDAWAGETGSADLETLLGGLPEAHEKASSPTDERDGPNLDDVEEFDLADVPGGEEEFWACLTKIIEHYTTKSTYNYKHLFEHSLVFMDIHRQLTLSPVLDKATNDWRLMLAIPEMRMQTIPPSAAAVEVVNTLGLGARGPIVKVFLIEGEIARVKLEGWDQIAVGKTWDKESGQVFLTFYHAYGDDVYLPLPLECPVPGLVSGWTRVLPCHDGLSFCLSPIPQPETPMHGRLEPTLSKGMPDPRFTTNSLAAAISADLFEGDGGDESKIVSMLKKAIDARAADFAREAREKLEKYERGPRHLQVPEL